MMERFKYTTKIFKMKCHLTQNHGRSASKEVVGFGANYGMVSIWFENSQFMEEVSRSLPRVHWYCQVKG